VRDSPARYNLRPARISGSSTPTLRLEAHELTVLQTGYTSHCSVCCTWIYHLTNSLAILVFDCDIQIHLLAGVFRVFRLCRLSTQAP
jgi:hypothetical protein